MKNKQVLVILLLIGLSITTFARKVEITDARLIAKNTYFEQVNRHDAIPFQAISITSEFVEKYNNQDVYYVFNINDKGFVILSADDGCYPVIGFSFESSYSPSNQAKEFTYWMNERKKEIASNIENNVLADANISNTWQRLETTDPSQLLDKSKKSVLDVAPLTTSLWDQTFPYNDLTPIDATCSGHLVTGCVATALSQIMYYWRWPLTGVGTHCDSHHNYGFLCAGFDTTTYDWNGMVDQPTQDCPAVALLMYHAGIAVDMYYNDPSSPCESGAYTSSVAGALKNFFRYSTQTTYVQKSAYSTTSWNSLLQGDLDIGEIIQYGGSGAEGGHSFVCDGYQATDYYHFNWGWSGSSNGYYYLTNLNPSGYNFDNNQEAIVHISPDPAQYPLFCAGTTNVVTDDFGTIEDGSGPTADYQNNSNCSWLIAPDDSVSKIILGFTKFNTDPADVLTVYDGPTTASPVLGTYSGSTLPTATPTSTGSQMLVTFVSNGSTTAPGFLLTYTATPISFCNSSTTLTDASGTFSDYSGRFQYRNGSNCKWYIQPANALSITLTFDNFNTEATNDKVLIYNAENPPTLLATYSGDHTSSPLDPITINSGKALVWWISNNSIRGAGWDASYNAVLDATNNLKAFKDISVYPNPTDGMINVKFTTNDPQSVRIEILSLTGETVFSQNLGTCLGAIEKQLDLSSNAKGIYILRLTSDLGITNEKVVLK